MSRQIFGRLRPWIVGFLGLGVACLGLASLPSLRAQDASASPAPAAASEEKPAAPQDSGGEAKPSEPAAAPEAKPAAEAAAEKPAAEPVPAEGAKPEANEQAKPEAKEAPATPPSAEPAAKTEPGAAKDAFAAKLSEWKSLLKELRKLRADFKTADPAKVEEIQKKWDELMARGETLIADLRETGKQAFMAAPNQDAELTGFLVKMVADGTARDDYEPAYELSRALIDNGCDAVELNEPAGIAAFATSHFDQAETCLQTAKDKGKLGENGQKYVGVVAEYKDYWAKEEELRKKEAEQNDLPRVRLTTSKGELVIELFENEAPGAVGNFISLVEQGFYNGLTFHRVLPGFMAQGGCPKGDGTGDPGYKIKCECAQDNARMHFRGSLSMAKSEAPNTGGSQFFLTFVPTPHLNKQHTVFGRVIEGFEVLPKLTRIDPEGSGPKPLADKIEKAEVIRKRDHEYKPNKVE